MVPLLLAEASKLEEPVVKVDYGVDLASIILLNLTDFDILSFYLLLEHHLIALQIVHLYVEQLEVNFGNDHGPGRVVRDYLGHYWVFRIYRSLLN